MMKRTSKLRRLEKVSQLAVSAVVLILVLRFVDTEALWNSLWRARPEYLLLVLLILPLSFLIRAYRWQTILRRAGQCVPLTDVFLLTFVGVALNFILPGGLGDIARSYYGYRRSGLKEEMLSSSVADKTLALMAVGVLGTVSAAFYGLPAYAYLSLAIAAVFGLILFIPQAIPWGVLSRAVLWATGKHLDAQLLTDTFRLSNADKAWLLAVSIAGWLVTYFQFYLICRAVAVEVSLLYVLALAPLVTLARLFPLTLNGLGSQEAVVLYLFGLMGIASAQALLVSLTFTFALVVIPGLVGLAVIVHQGLANDRQPDSVEHGPVGSKG